MRKIKILLGALTIGLFLTASVVNLYADERLPPGDGDRIICKCTILSNCKASGSSGVCAQSEPGGNIQCSNWNSNC